MAQKYYNVKDAAGLLGISEAEVKQMLERRELYGYRDGADWKFKAEDIERLAQQRAAEAPPADEDDDADVLASEVELGHSDPSLSGTVIGVEKGANPAESDISLSSSDVKLGDSDIRLVESEINLGGEKKPAAKDDVAKKVSQFEELDLTLDEDLSLEDSNVASAPEVKPAARPEAKAPAAGDSALDLSGKKLEDDDLVLGGSGTGSDITIGGDSGISLVDPSDSGLSLEAPLSISAGDESLELGEDDFQLTPLDDGGDGEDSESGSQVIALDTEGESDEAATMVGVAGAGGVVAMLDEDLGGEPLMSLDAAPLMTPAEAGLDHPEVLAMDSPGGVAVMALPEAPYTIWQILSLVACSIFLMLVGMMMFDLLRSMWGWQGAHPVNSWLMDTVLSWFE